MQSKIWNVIGLMSGTSLDGLDLVFTKISQNNELYTYEIICSDTISYSKEWESVLRNAFNFDLESLSTLSVTYGKYLAACVRDFMENNGIHQVDFIASHGHTILHRPEEGYTLQIGDGKILSEIIGVDVVCDFRTQDVEMNGQGAPLVPIGDRLLFSNFDYCLNLGGFANISFEKNKQRIAFDICPVNIVLNHYSKKIGFDFDKNGEFAKSGSVDKDLLEELNSLSYYEAPIPKSLGFEFVMEYIFPIIDEYKLPEVDILRTFVEHIVYQISVTLENNSSLKLLVTGGGAFNGFLMNALKEKNKIKIIVPKAELINYKEALIFALLGVLKVQNKVNCLSSVTGATKDHSSGKIFRFRK